MSRYRIFRSAHPGVRWEIDQEMDGDLTLHVGRARTLRAAVRRVRTDAACLGYGDEVEITVPTVERRRR